LDAGDRHETLRRLRGLLAQQRDVIAAAQRQSREIEQWIAEVEFADADDFPVRESTGSRRGSADATRLRDVASISLPVFGHLPAGWPQTREGVAQQQPARTASVARGRFPEGAFGLDVRGDSMNAAAPSPIQDGDTVVLLPPELRSPQVGDVVAALIDGETCLKRLVRGAAAEAGGREEHHLRSESTNPVHGEIYPVHELVIQGVLVGKL
jgi:repressor LexA